MGEKRIEKNVTDADAISIISVTYWILWRIGLWAFIDRDGEWRRDEEE